jgi:hypothetical protein
MIEPPSKQPFAKLEMLEARKSRPQPITRAAARTQRRAAMHAFRYCSLNGGGQNRYKEPEGATERSARSRRAGNHGAKVSGLFMPVNSPFVSRERGNG